MLIGTSFSHKQAAWLSLDPHAALQTLIDMRFDLIRLGCYWNEIEKEPGKYDFSVIKRLLELCEEKKQSVVLTIGMKAPRWPEFYIPAFYNYPLFLRGGRGSSATIENRSEHFVPSLHNFLTAAVTTLMDYSCLTHWQVENEPLDPSGPDKLAIPVDMLREEIALVKKLDSNHPIVVTFWGNALKKRNHPPQIIDSTDIIGIDLYYKQCIAHTFGKTFYAGPQHSDEKIVGYIKQCAPNPKEREQLLTSSPSRERIEERGIAAHATRGTLDTRATSNFWIAELQAEPWEASGTAYKSENPKSMNPELLRKNIQRAKKMNPGAILLWGSEYWLWKQSKGDSRMVDTVKEIIKEVNL